MNKFIILALLIGAQMCLAQNFTQNNITVNPSLDQNATNYKDINNLFANITQACGQVDNCNIYLANGFNYTILESFSYSTRTTILFIKSQNAKELVTIQLNNSINLSNQGNVFFIGINFVVPQRIFPAVFVLTDAAALFVTDSIYTNNNFIQIFANVKTKGGVNLKNVTANINIQGFYFIITDNGATNIDQLYLNNVAGNNNDVIFYFKNSQSVNLNTLVVNGGNTSVIRSENSTVNINKSSVIKGLTNPAFVIYVKSGSQLSAQGLEISNIDLTKSSYQNAIKADDSRVQLDSYTCSAITSLYYPCLYIQIETSNTDWNSYKNVPISNSKWNANNILGNYSGLAMVISNGSSAYYYQQFNDQRQLLGQNNFDNNKYSNSKLNASIGIRFSGQYDLKVTVAKADGTADGTKDNIYYLYNVNPSINLFNYLNVQYTDVIGQTFDDKQQLQFIDTSSTVMYLVAPHKNITYTFNSSPENKTQANGSSILAALRSSEIFRNTYLIPSQDQCAQVKSFNLSTSISFSFDGLTASLPNGPQVDSPSTTWYLAVNMNLDQGNNGFKRSSNNFLNLNGSLYVLPLKTADKQCDNGQGLVCKTNQFISSNDTCANCDSSCGTCSGFGKDKCLTCSNEILVAQNGRCVCDSPKQVLINGQCYNQGDAKSLLESYDFSAIVSLTDLQFKLRVALNYAQVISAVGLDVATDSLPCGQNNQCSGQGSCQLPAQICVCNPGFSGSLCQFSTSEYNNIIVRAQNASQSLSIIASRIGAQSVISPADIRNETLAAVLITQIQDSLNQQVLSNLTDVLNFTSTQADKNYLVLELVDLEVLAFLTDQVLFTSLKQFNITNGKAVTNQLYNILQLNINNRIKRDKATMDSNPNLAFSFFNDRLTIQYTLLNFDKYDGKPYVQSIGTNNISLPQPVIQQIQDVTKETFAVYKLVNFKYNPRKLQDEFQAQSEVILSQVLYGKSYYELNIDTTRLNSQSLELQFTLDPKYTGARCYQYDSSSSLWSLKSNGNYTSSLSCKYNGLGLYAASNSTKGTINAIINNFQFALFGFIALIYVLLQ